MITISTGRRATAFVIPLVLGAALTGCAAKRPDYLQDYADHPHLRVTGYPVADSLEVVQKFLWRLADGEVDGVAALDTEGGDARPAARAWIKEYGKAARGEVSADFEEDFAVRQPVVLHFTGPTRTEESTARPGPHDTWGLVLVNPAPKDVKKSNAAPTTR
ncbi:hypothetical protein [Streptomyces sp. AM6-12]|uniref:hypothetical protein n=1 Tax=Streptomyces sp. AM6-12 TaxID=3345149 RepID=UPI003797C15D